MRAFIALPIQGDAQKQLAEYLQPMSERYRVSWIKPQNMHVTLHFLGDIDERTVPAISAIIDEAGAVTGAFPVHLRGIGRFPIRGRPRVLFVPMVHGVEQCEALYEYLKNRLRGIVTMDDRPFTPHVTLARIKPKHRIPYVVDGPDFSFTADHMAFYESVLQPEGALYRQIAVGYLNGHGPDGRESRE